MDATQTLGTALTKLEVYVSKRFDERSETAVRAPASKLILQRKLVFVTEHEKFR